MRDVFAMLDVSWGRVARAVALGIACLSSALGLTAVSAWLIARASQHPVASALAIAAVAVRFFGISRAVFRYLERLASHDVALRGVAHLRRRLYEVLAAGDPARLLRLGSGDLLARVGTDVDEVGNVVVRSLIPAIVAGGMGLVAVVIVGAFNLAAAAVLALCLVVASVVAPWLTFVGVRRGEEAAAAARSDLSQTVLSGLADASAVRVSGGEERLASRLREADASLWRGAYITARYTALGTLLGTLALGVAVLAAIVFGVPDTLAGQMAPVELAVVVLVPLAAFEASSVLPAAAVQWHRSATAAGRIAELLPEGTPGDEVGRGTDLVHESGQRDDDGNRHGVSSGLRARNLAVGWTTPVLQDVDLDVQPGRAVAVVGPSGVGKTTLLATLAGLMKPLAGSVDLAGALPQPPAVAYCPENAHVFATTIEENVRVARGDLADATALLERVGLAISALPDGAATVLGTGGHTLSGGERRRLLLARALASPARFLLLDEPVEHVDADADALLDLIAREAHDGGRAVVVVTHRLRGLDAYDEVVVLDGEPGRVVARGTHAALLADNASYRRLQEDE